MNGVWLPNTTRHHMPILEHGPRAVTRGIVIHVNDGESDTVDCGRDRDVAIVDLGDLDKVSNCEVVIQRAPNPQDDQQDQ